MPQRVLVTAGANGIELAIAQAFAADVPACTSLTSSGFAPEAVSEFVDEVDWVTGSITDVSDSASVDALFADIQIDSVGLTCW